eukprot:TRINITY_DN14252_c0_g1_i1.p1 TRINITY_DN14252_c0_g1~~TRINITY_DN14252_c0_g1_i1.p1  ORF type:complete len:115 (+),score=29.02 TRINITY_DN14252_c0_g1_i1:83-427(+)
MKQNTTNCPSSNNWVKFEDIEQVSESSSSNSASPLPMVENAIQASYSGSKLAVILQPVKTHAKEPKIHSVYTHSRYAAFDSLRVEVSKSNQMGWSSYLLGEEGKADTRNRTFQG